MGIVKTVYRGSRGCSRIKKPNPNLDPFYTKVAKIAKQPRRNLGGKLLHHFLSVANLWLKLSHCLSFATFALFV